MERNGLDLPRTRPSTDPGKAIATERLSGSKGSEDLARSGRQCGSDNLDVPLDGRSVPLRILQDHDQSNRSGVLGSKRFALAIGSAVLVLEVDDHAFDFCRDDLLRPEEHGIDRFPVLPNCQFDRWRHRSVCARAKALGECELAGITQRWLPTRVSA